MSFSKSRGSAGRLHASIHNFFSNSDNRAEIGRLLEAGVLPVNDYIVPAVSHSLISGKRICFTGTLEKMPRSEAKKMTEALGAIVVDSVGKQLDYLVAGAEPGSKLDKAIKLGIAVLDEAAFLDIVKDNVMKALRINVSGRVQGVCFRANARDEARRIGVTGWVRNLSDGTVEVFVQGPEEKVNRLLVLVLSGPSRCICYKC